MGPVATLLDRRALDYRQRKLSSYDAINIALTYKQDKHSTHKQGQLKPITFTAMTHMPNTQKQSQLPMPHFLENEEHTYSFLLGKQS